MNDAKKVAMPTYTKSNTTGFSLLTSSAGSSCTPLRSVIPFRNSFTLPIYTQHESTVLMIKRRGFAEHAAPPTHEGRCGGMSYLIRAKLVYQVAEHNSECR